MRMLEGPTRCLSVLTAGPSLWSSGLHGQEPVQPLEPVREIDVALAELGNQLYFGPRLFKWGFSSCHNLNKGGLGPPKDIDRLQLDAGSDQRADGPQLQSQSGPVLKCPWRDDAGAGRRANRSPGREGLHARTGGGHAGGDSRLSA